MTQNNGTWYVVADGGKARVLQNGGEGLHTVRAFDASGRGNAVEDADTGTSQLKAPKADPKEQAELHFAKALTEFLNQSVQQNKVKSLVIAAPAQVLGEIRQQLSKAAGDAVEKTLTKDYTNTPDSELAKLLAE